MSLISRITDTLTGRSEVETFSYRCETCHATFESPEENPGAASCESCGSVDVKPAGA